MPMHHDVWCRLDSGTILWEIEMRKESTIVVYDYSQATAEEIAAKLGAEAVSVQCLNERTVENSRNFVLELSVQGDGQLTPLWQYGRELLLSVGLSGKTVAMYVCGTSEACEPAIADFCSKLKQGGAHVVGPVLYTASRLCDIDSWIASISPNLKS